MVVGAGVVVGVETGRFVVVVDELDELAHAARADAIPTNTNATPNA